MKTAPIPTITRDEVLDALDFAARRLTEATHADWPHDVRSRAAEGLEWLRWAAELVRHDEHDSTMLLRIGNVIADLHAIAPHAPVGVVDAARRLRTASLLLQAARRQADLEVRLRAILDHADDISPSKTAKHLEQVRSTIARLARA